MDIGVQSGGHGASMKAANDRNIFLSTLPASRRDRTAASIVVGVSFVLFALAVPYAGIPLMPVPAFVASYQSALAINDVITAVLLFSQFAILKSRGLLYLASGYLFTAAAALVHALSFPGLFAVDGVFGGGPQTTVWIFMIWHGGFPLFVLAYAVNKGRDGGAKVQLPTMTAILASIAAIGIATLAYVWLVTGGHDLLPTLLSGGHYTPIMMGVVSTMWGLSLVALIVMWFRRPHSVIDIWLMVVLCAWLFDIALSAIVNVARFDLGFYAGRLYGLCAASFVLAVLLVDNVALQAQMSRLVRAMRREAAFVRDQHKVRERLFSSVVESSNDAIITKSLNGTITGWNPAAERLFGYAEHEAVGEHISMIVPPHRSDEVDTVLGRIRRGEVIENLETVRIHKDGENIEVALTLSPLRSATGEIIGASKIIRDVSETRPTRSALSRESEERQRIFE